MIEEVIVAMLRYAPPGVLDGNRSAKSVATLVKMSLLDMDLALSSYFAAEEAKRAEVIDQLNATMAQIEAQREAREKATQRIGVALSALAANDFTAKLDGLPEDFAQLGQDFEEMRANVSKALAAVAHSVSGINTGSSEIRAAADDLAMRTQQQAASLEETAATIERLTTGIESAATGAEEITVKVHEANGEAQTGETVAREAVAAMEKIQRSAQEISKIIELIDGIAFQTNLVALNAGVEAVRAGEAGEAGKGFAVVANEVRALAQRSAEAAREIKELVTGSVDEVEKGVDLVRHSGDAFTRITGRVGEIAERISVMSADSRTQSTNLQHVNLAMREMDQMTQQNAAMVEQTTAASRSLASEAQDLDAMVSRFQLGGDESVVPLRPARGRKTARPAPMRREMGSARFAAQTASEDWSEF